MNNICQTYSASTLQQSYKIVTGTDGNLEKKKVFPVSVIQAIYDGETGKRLDAILQERGGGGGGSFTTEVVVSLPSVGTNGTIYLILNKESSVEENIYDEYIWVDSIGDYEKLGSLGTDIDLSNYVTKTEFKTLDTEVQGLDTELGTVKTSVQNINTSVQGLNTNVSNINTSIGNLNTAVNDLNTDVESLEGAVQVTSTAVNLGSANKATALKGTALTYNNKNIATTDLIPDISNKVDKESGKGLSSNDYTTTEKNKLAGIEAGAQKNAVSSVNSKTGAVTLTKADLSLGNVTNDAQVKRTEMGANNGVAQLSSTGTVPVAQLPLATTTSSGIITKEEKASIATIPNKLGITDAANTYATKSTTGSLSDLTTTSKTSLVSAINEVKASGGSVSLNHYSEDAYSATITIDSTQVANFSTDYVSLYPRKKLDISTPELCLDGSGDMKIYDAFNTVHFKYDSSGSAGIIEMSSGAINLTSTTFKYNNSDVATSSTLSSYYTKTETTNLLNNKVDKVSGKALSTNDYTTAEKTKLSGIAANANNYSLPTAASGTLGGIKLGYSTTGDNNNYAVQVDASGNAYVNVPWYVITYPMASSNTEGLMAKEDKAKLDGIAVNANNYSLPASSSSALGGIKVGYTTSDKNYAVRLDSSNNAYVNVPWANTTYGVATANSNGLMSKEDKTKLDNLDAAGEVILTQAEYNALSTKDENTIYYIVG